jgi:hypothetical protein
MRVLANENFPAVAVDALRLAGHDVIWIRTVSPGISDREVLARDIADLVTEWAALHREELLEDWELARQQAQLNRIAPLE